MPDFVLHLPTGRIGVVVRDENDAGMFRGTLDVWFGEYQMKGANPSIPVIREVEEKHCERFNNVPLGDPLD